MVPRSVLNSKRLLTRLKRRGGLWMRTNGQGADIINSETYRVTHKHCGIVRRLLELKNPRLYTVVYSVQLCLHTLSLRSVFSTKLDLTLNTKKITKMSTVLRFFLYLNFVDLVEPLHPAHRRSGWTTSTRFNYFSLFIISGPRSKLWKLYKLCKHKRG